MRLRLRPLTTTILLALLALGLAACETTRHLELPAPQMSSPGWEIRRGQAIWRAKANKPEVAGDFITGRNPQLQSTFAEFNKATIPVLETRTIGDSWEIALKVRDYKRTGSEGLNPDIIWLHVPQILAGEAPPTGWQIDRSPDRIIVTNPDSGEKLELYPFKTRA